MKTSIWMSGALLLAAVRASAAFITWNPAGIGDGSEVSTTGTLLEAWNLGDFNFVSDVEVNGVMFEAVTAAGIDGTYIEGTFNQRWGRTAVYDSTNYAASPAGGLYDALLDGMQGRTAAGGAVTITLSGLEVGKKYELQMFVVDDRPGSLGRSILLNKGRADEFTQAYGGSTNGDGQLITATFTADATTQDFTHEIIKADDTSAGGHMNAIQLRDLSSPEIELRIVSHSGTEIDFEWTSEGGMQYDLVSSSDLSTAAVTWPVYNDGSKTYNEIAASGTGTNTLDDVAALGSTRFFAVLGEPVPPIFFSGFEPDDEPADGGFSATSGDWMRGEPDSANTVLTVDSGNGGSDNCWATNLGDVAGGTNQGYITADVDSILRSPDINLSGVVGAQLSFAAAVDAQATDELEILIKNAADDATLGFPIYPITLPETLGWTDYGPFDLSAGDGSTIYLEFRFKGSNDLYLGLYLDDVTVDLAP